MGFKLLERRYVCYLIEIEIPTRHHPTSHRSRDGTTTKCVASASVADPWHNPAGREPRTECIGMVAAGKTRSCRSPFSFISISPFFSQGTCFVTTFPSPMTLVRCYMRLTAGKSECCRELLGCCWGSVFPATYIH